MLVAARRLVRRLLIAARWLVLRLLIAARWVLRLLIAARRLVLRLGLGLELLIPRRSGSRLARAVRIEQPRIERELGSGVRIDRWPGVRAGVGRVGLPTA